MSLDVRKIRADFPIFKRTVKGKPLVYLDSASTSQKPTSVIEAMNEFYSRYNSNIHRGIHTLAEEATAAYEDTRDKVCRFINAPDPRSIVFTSGTTESINLVAQSYVGQFLKEGDELVLTQMEHHSNLVPWILIAKKKGLKLKYLPITKDGILDATQFESVITKKTKFLAITSMSNVLGTIPPVKQLIDLAHSVGAKVLIDGAQGVPHFPTNVQELDCDFLAFSAHKMLGPTGVGVLYAKPELLDAMPPYKGGGEMISKVSFNDVTFNTIPYKFEAGTPNIGGVIGFGAAIDYLSKIGMDQVKAHDQTLTRYALNRLIEVEGVSIIGDSPIEARGGVISFLLGDLHPHDVGTALDFQGIATRAGHHCAMPLMGVLDVVATVRTSFYLYNSTEDVDKLVDALGEVRRFFNGR